MVGTCGRWARIGLAVGLVVSVAAGCGGDSKTKTIKVPVQPGDSWEVWQQRALSEASEICAGKKPPEQVVFAFAKEDEKTEVAADVAEQKVPASAACSGFVQPQSS
jgi:hypothetical protein